MEDLEEESSSKRQKARGFDTVRFHFENNPQFRKEPRTRLWDRGATEGAGNAERTREKKGFFREIPSVEENEPPHSKTSH